MPKERKNEIPTPVVGGIIAALALAVIGGGWYMFIRRPPRPPMAPMVKVVNMSGSNMASQLQSHPMAKGLASAPPTRFGGGKGAMPAMPMDPNVAARGGGPPMPGGMSPGMRPPGAQGQRPRFGIPTGKRPGMPGGAVAGGMPDGAGANMPAGPGSMPAGNAVPDNIPKPGEMPPLPPGAPKDVTVQKVDPHSIKIPKP